MDCHRYGTRSGVIRLPTARSDHAVLPIEKRTSGFLETAHGHIARCPQQLTVPEGQLFVSSFPVALAASSQLNASPSGKSAMPS